MVGLLKMTVSKLFLSVYASALCIVCISGIAAAQDPYKNVTLHTLSNGMDVVLAHSSQAENVKVKVRVNVGKVVEVESNLGVSHLLEHLIFRDSRFNDEQTYSNLIEENGGTINASVGRDETAYYATIPFQKGEWLIEEFANMLFNLKIEQEAIDRAKSSVELETGEPSWLAERLGVDIFATLIYRYFPKPDYYESEFGISESFYSRNEYKLSNRKLTKDQLLKHYESYYYPSNMALFVTGKFDADKMLSLIEQKFGNHPDRKGKTVPTLEPASNNKPYRRVKDYKSSSAYIYIGTKYLNVPPEDSYSMTIYLDYLSHHIMKELRNKRGETYTANVYEDNFHGAGYGIVAFETQVSEYQKNLKYVSSLIEKQTINGALTDKQIKEAIRMTKQQRFELAESDADSIMVYAEHYYDYFQEYGIADSPYKLISTITPEEFRKSLKNVFKKENSYSIVYLPYIYSKLDSFVIFILSIVFSIVFFQRVLRRRVDETCVKWTQKMSYSPAMFFEVIACLILSSFIYHFIMAPIDRILHVSEWYHSASLWPIYMNSFASLFLNTGIFMGCLATFPRKIMIEGNAIVLKSMALYSRKFEKSSIKTIRAISLFDLIMSPKIWLSLRFRYFYNTLLIWRKGLLLEICDGPKYFLDFKNAEDVSAKLNEHFFGADENNESDSPINLETKTDDNYPNPAND